jgi:hypothetical protein
MWYPRIAVPNLKAPVSVLKGAGVRHTSKHTAIVKPLVHDAHRITVLAAAHRSHIKAVAGNLHTYSVVDLVTCGAVR